MAVRLHALGAHSSVSRVYLSPFLCGLFSRHGPSIRAVLIYPSLLQPDMYIYIHTKAYIHKHVIYKQGQYSSDL